MVLHILRSRKFVKRAMIVLSVIIIPAFVFWGVGSYATRPPIIGKIYGKAITVQDLAKSRKGIMIQVLLSYFHKQKTMDQILNNRNLVNYMSWERLIMLNSSKKFKVPDNSVITFIASHPLFTQNGVFSQQVYDYILRNTLEINERQFEEIVRENIKIRALRQKILQDVSVSEEEILNIYHQINDKTEISFLYFSTNEIEESFTASSEEINSYYESNLNKFIVPGKATIEYIEFDYANVGEKEKIIAIMERIYPELQKNSTSLAEVSKKENLKYSTTEPFSSNDIVPGIPVFSEFYDTVFSLDNNTLGLPIFSGEEKGKALILRRTSLIPEEQQSLGDVSEKIASILATDKKTEILKKVVDGVSSDIQESGLSLEKAAEKYNRKIEKAQPFMANDYIQNIGPAINILKQINKNEIGSISLPVRILTGYIIARKDGVIKDDESKLDEEKEKINENLLSQKQAAALEAWFKKENSNVQLITPLEEL